MVGSGHYSTLDSDIFELWIVTMSSLLPDLLESYNPVGVAFMPCQIDLAEPACSQTHYFLKVLFTNIYVLGVLHTLLEKFFIVELVDASYPPALAYLLLQTAFIPRCLWFW
jgi:hypothetical protein